MSETALAEAPDIRESAPEPAGNVRFKWNALQVKFILLQGLGFVFLLGTLLLFRFEPTSSLFTAPQGIRMLGMSVCWLLVGNAGAVVLCLVLDAKCAAWSQQHSKLCLCLFGLLEALQLYLFFLPIIFVMVIGPSTLSIMNTMLQR